ncbi:TnsA-like heteromeric transposase endonuclease subunit [Actinacidiphila oryziradicis]|uniref:TnsA-like heteromeric transposase endonuclease subunit n=2 Tax=Actinacidiphila oryziradicis TaxID=2571141 RepID=A0A4U0RVC4_9ACTN|nr:TnsA-like heteromeric transposase endonuclease subunit [Actinacidiphila oryziradicis]TJZ99446.1 TnsA-like heteromeric transposase endonuclease subunit [Actinacidiphila oryziradicis]
MEAVFASPTGQLVQQRWLDAAQAARFEELPPVSAFPVVPGRRWGPGWWWSATTGRHVTHGSAAMRTQLMVLDRNPDIVALAGRPVRLVWRDPGDGQVHSWVPQLFARYTDGTGLLADCPSTAGAAGTRAQRAAEAVAAACAAVGWSYQRLEMPEAVTTANLRWLAGYRHPRHAGGPELATAVLGAFAQPRPLAEGAAAVGDPLAVMPVVYHALWAGWLQTDLARPLHQRTVIGPGRTRDQEQSEQ